jgi:acyl-coenzyme A synthetase/AMP-(fatty) acid ligase
LPHLVTSLGLMRLGCNQIGLASQDPMAMRADLAVRIRAAAIIGDRAEDAIEGVGLIIPDHEAIAGDAGLDDRHIPAPGPEGTTVLLTSSGTTGRPKLIPLSERLMRTWGLIRMNATERRFLPVAVEFGQARRAMLTTLAAGGSWVFANNGDELHLIELVRRHRVDLVTMAPRRAETLLTEVPRLGAAGRWPEGARLSVTGATVPGALRQRIQSELTHDLFVPYGVTEFGLGSIALPEDHARHPDGVGRPWGTEMIVVDDRGRRLPPGQPGILRVLSVGRTDGYFDDPEASAKVFLPGGWYHTGDVATITPDGHILFGGRGDDMMILGTINVFPAEIERAAEGFAGVADCAAFALRMQAHGDVPMIAVVETAPGALDHAALAAHCRARLGLRAPRKVLVVAGIPRNAAGKVLRRDLAAMMQAATADAAAQTGSA